MTVHGKKATFSKQKPSNELIKAYPKTKPSHSVEGEYRGEFSVLTEYIALAIDPSFPDDNEIDCLTERGERGLFQWSDATMHKLESCKISGADSLEEKQIFVVLCMLQFTYELMMHPSTCVTSNPLKPFMGRAINLQKARES